MLGRPEGFTAHRMLRSLTSLYALLLFAASVIAFERGVVVDLGFDFDARASWNAFRLLAVIPTFISISKITSATSRPSRRLSL